MAQQHVIFESQARYTLAGRAGRLGPGITSVTASLIIEARIEAEHAETVTVVETCMRIELRRREELAHRIEAGLAAGADVETATAAAEWELVRQRAGASGR